MSITLIRNAPSPGEPPVSPALTEWHRRIGDLGQTIALRQCHNEREAAGVVREAKRLRTELLVVDCGDAMPGGELSKALQDCGVPYVELHRDDFRQLDRPLPRGRCRIGLVQGYGQRGLDLAFWVAYEALGGEAANDDYHVST
jgi:3-dehydroquinate dehydratase